MRKRLRLPDVRPPMPRVHDAHLLRAKALPKGHDGGPRGEVVPSPSSRTAAGRKVSSEDPHSAGFLGIAISEAVETALHEPQTKYSLGSILNHVLLHQTIGGEEAILQMKMVGDYPDVVVGCVGGGSNFAGLMLPFFRETKQRGNPVEFVAVEPVACPSITKGEIRYD